MRRFISLFISFWSATAFASFQVPDRGVTFPKRQAGEIFMWGGPSCPTGTQALDGSSLLRAGTYAKLFIVLGTTYGAVDGTHFTVPNTQGVFMRGSGSQTISAITYTGTRGTSQNDHFTSHNHSLRGNVTGGGAVPLGVGSADEILGLTTGATGIGYYNLAPASGVPYVSSAGSGTETQPANITLLYCIIY